MSTTAASFALRRCLRSSSSTVACRNNPTVSKAVKTFTAGEICSARGISSASVQASPRHLSHDIRSSLILRMQPSKQKPSASRSSKRYSSSIQGTIGSGEAGIPSEAAREVDILQAPEHLNEKEREIWDILHREFKPTRLDVQDISGGCGSMYGIEVVSERFRGLNMLKQQRLVNEVLGEEIKGWHGVQLRTSVP